MKSLTLMIAMFAIMLTAITILKHESSKLDLKIKTANDIRNKLNYDLSFLQSEWEYVSSPEKIERLSILHLDLKYVSLINFHDFLNFLNSEETIK